MSTAPEQQTQIAKQDQQPKTLKGLISGEQFKAQLSMVTAKHMTADRMVRVALTAMLKTPDLADCDQASFCLALLTLASYGLEPNGRQAHLIPFRNNQKGITECQLIIDYKGLAELVMRSGLVSNIHADIVCENDLFRYSTGVLACHEIDLKKPRGDMYAAYCLVRMKDGTEKCEVMSKDEIEAIRRRSKTGTRGPWVTDFFEMAKKTVFRRVSKWLPLSPEIRDAFLGDDDVIEGKLADSKPKPRTLGDLTQTLTLPAPAPEPQQQEPLTPEQSYKKCLTDVAPMSLEEAQAHIRDKVNTDGWDMQWSLDMDKVLEGKAGK